MLAALVAASTLAVSAVSAVSAIAPGEHPRPLRIAVQEPVVDEGIDKRVGGLVAMATVRELRKLDGVTVVSLDEVKALLEQESNRELAGCSQDSCLGEIADALGADTIVTLRLGKIGGEHFLSMRRLVMSDATATKSVEKRLPDHGGEEFLSAVGGAVAELFPDHSLQRGQERGVAREVVKRLNPPPLSPWWFGTTAALSGVMLAAGAVAGGAVLALDDGMQKSLAQSSPDHPADGAELTRTFALADQTALAANTLLGTGAALALGSGALFFFTDFEGLRDAPVDE